MLLSSNNEIYIISYIFLPAILLYKSKILKKSQYNYDFLSKKETDQVKGLLILIIILHHISQRMVAVGLMLPFKHVGYLAVSMFFFLSGYGLTASRKTNISLLENFFSKRFNRVYLPFFIINIVTILIYSIIFDDKYTTYKIVQYAVGIELIDKVTWFVITILIFYIGYYISFSIFSDKLAVKLLLLFSLIYSFICFYIGKDTYWYNTSLCFPIGVYTSLNFNKVFNTLKNKNYINIVFFLIIVFSSLFLLSKLVHILMLRAVLETILSVIFVIISLLLLIKVELNSKFLSFFGIISYEMYLLHMKIYSIYFNYVSINESYSIALYLILVIILSMIFRQVIKFVDRFLISYYQKLTYIQPSN